MQPTRPKHPVYALATWELAERRRDLEHHLGDLPMDASERVLLQRELDEIAAEEQSRGQHRASKQGNGVTTSQHPALTMTGGREFGTWLRQQREARTWARPEMARQLIKAAQANGDTSMPGVDSLTHNIYRWERGTVGPSERYRLYLCQAFRIPPADFGTGQGTAQTYRFRFPGAEVAEFFRLLADFAAIVRDLRAELRSSAGETAIQAAPGVEERPHD